MDKIRPPRTRFHVVLNEQLARNLDDLTRTEGVSRADIFKRARGARIIVRENGQPDRQKKKVILDAGTSVSLLGALLGLWFALVPQSSPTIRTMAAGWVGVVLGQAKKVWGN